MVTLQEVDEGLGQGKSYKRPLDNGGFEYVRPCPYNHYRFEHTVAGENEQGGYGGVAELSRNVLSAYNGWASDGWIEE